MSDYGTSADEHRAFVIVFVVGVLLIATAGFFIGRCSARYTVKVQVQPTQEKEKQHDAP